MIEITNHCNNIIADNQIKQCLDLLPKTHRELDIKITFYNSRIQVIKDNIEAKRKFWLDLDITFEKEFRKYLMKEYMDAILQNKKLRLELTNKIAGDFSDNKNEIRVFMYAILKKYKKKSAHKIVNTLYHEIRHKYQSIYLIERYKKDNENYIPIGEGYEEQWIEKDARNFADRMIETHKYSLSNILGVDFNENIRM